MHYNCANQGHRNWWIAFQRNMEKEIPVIKNNKKGTSEPAKRYSTKE
jgi:hypothetical protein